MSRLADGAVAFCRGRSASKLIGKTAPEHREDGRLFRLQTRKCITQLILYLGLDLEQQIAVHVRAEQDRMPLVLEDGDLPLWLGETPGDPTTLLRAPAAGILKCRALTHGARGRS